MSDNLCSAPILVLEDNDQDFDIIQQVFDSKGIGNPLLRFHNGDQCLDHLAQRRPSSLLPALLVLDLNTPGTDGREVLTEIKRDPQLKTIPVIVMSSSANPKDIEFCYANGANSYQVKPMDISEFDRRLQALVEYWLATAVLPAAIQHRV
ncbi:MAG: response regulator [Gammaproteobacteria bacterium]